MKVTSVKTGEEPPLSQLVDTLRGQGYPCPLLTRPDAIVRCPTHDREVSAGSVHIDSYRRFEGVSDPEAEAMVVAVRWPEGAPGCSGVLVLGFGPTAGPEDSMVLAELRFDGSESTPIA